MEFFSGSETMEIPDEVLSLIPEESARFYKIIPLELKEKTLEVAMVNPDDIKAREAIDFIARKTILTLRFA